MRLKATKSQILVRSLFFAYLLIGFLIEFAAKASGHCNYNYLNFCLLGFLNKLPTIKTLKDMNEIGCAYIPTIIGFDVISLAVPFFLFFIGIKPVVNYTNRIIDATICLIIAGAIICVFTAFLMTDPNGTDIMGRLDYLLTKSIVVFSILYSLSGATASYLIFCSLALYLNGVERPEKERLNG